MTTVTSLEARILKAFETYTGENAAEATKSDLGVSWTDAKDLSTATELPAATVAGVLGSLVKKGLVHADPAAHGKPAAVCLTDEGVDVLFLLPAIDFADENTANQWDAAGEATDALNTQVAGTPETSEADAFTAALIKAGADEEYAKGMGHPFPGIICATLRAFAGTWTGTRATFIQTAQLAGFNRFTAQTQWQRAKTEAGALTLAAALAQNAVSDALGGVDAE